MKYFAVLLLIVISQPLLFAQDVSIDLWPEGGIPNQNNMDEKEVQENINFLWITNVQKPKIDVFLPAMRSRTGEAVVIFPGGGYYGLAYDWEGIDIAKWLNSQGVVAVVVKYRLPISKSIIEPFKAPIQDAQRALRIVRSHAEEWKLQEGKIGIIGFSAGGHLASTLGTHFNTNYYDAIDDIDNYSVRPDFMALIYPVIKMGTEDSHQGSKNALIGVEDNPELIAQFSNQLRVTKDTPKTFLIHSIDDDVVPVNNSEAFMQALIDNGVSVESHFYPTGGHGFGMAIKAPSVASWKDLFLQWMKK